jgi:hypothetical protein
MLYKREEKKKKKEKWGRGVNCEEEMREKKMRWVRGDVCVWWGRRKKKGTGYMGGGEKKKGKKKNGEWGLRIWWEKRGCGKKRRKKNLKGKKLNWFYLYVHFVWCKV